MPRNSKPQNPVIVIMAKVPRSGLVKTRLRPVLSESQCVELAACFLKDTVLKARKLSENIIVAFSPADGRDEIISLLPENTNLIEQSGKDLGERMKSAIEFAEHKGFSPIIVIGTDSPTIPPEYMANAFELFEDNATKIVFGAAADGGYYLIGLREMTEGLFENIEWSSEKTFAQTVANALKIFNCEPVQIPVWYDVDTPADLKFLHRKFLEDKDFNLTAPNTAKWLEKYPSLLDSID